MPSVLVNQNSRAGLCPHGLPQSACPICIGGQTAGVVKKSVRTDIKMQSGKWSFMKCYMEGLSIRSRQIHIQNMKDNFRRQLESADNLREEIRKIFSKLQSLSAGLKNYMPVSLHKPLEISLKFVFNILNKFPDLIKSSAEFQKDFYLKMLSAFEKLTAVYADFKSFIQKNFSDKFKQKFKKFYLFLFTGSFEENYGSDETLAVFKSREIKKYLVKILNKIKKKETNHD